MALLKWEDLDFLKIIRINPVQMETILNHPSSSESLNLS